MERSVDSESTTLNERKSARVPLLIYLFPSLRKMGILILVSLKHFMIRQFIKYSKIFLFLKILIFFSFIIFTKVSRYAFININIGMNEKCVIKIRYKSISKLSQFLLLSVRSN